MELKKNLQEFFRKNLRDPGLTLSELVRYTEGWSCETFRVGLTLPDGPREFIIRKQPLVGLISNYNMEKEYRVLKALMSTDMKSPKVFWFEPDPAVMGCPFYVMELVPGEVPVPPMKDEKQVLFPDEKSRRALAGDFVDILVRLHRADWRALGLDFLGDPGPGKGAARAQVKYWEDNIRHDQLEPYPVVTQAVLWLRDHLPEAEKTCIIHGDYRTGNYITRDGRIQAILDWEFVHLGDPMEELAYTMDVGWRSGPPDFLISHLMTESEFLKLYQEKSGLMINKEALEFYRVLSALKMVGMGVGATKAFSGGNARDLRIAVFHYRTYPFLYVLAKTLGVV
ncbi:MAG: phosphotransferase family protein [bacterium]|nr:phosphotransferase family protein [bacterium]